jgi:putative oxidoreductase
VTAIKTTEVPRWRAAINKTTRLLRRVEPHGQSAVLLALRLLYGWFFAETGWGKLMNFERTSGFFESLGLPAPAVMAGLVGSTELVGGLLLAAGLGTRFAAASLSVVMVIAMATAHAEEAFASLSAFTEQAPYPFLVATLVLLAFGAGRLSLDDWLRARATRRRLGATTKAMD